MTAACGSTQRIRLRRSLPADRRGGVELKMRSCFIDGEAVVVDTRGLSAFDLLLSWRHDGAGVLCAFDLIELDGEDLRRKRRRVDAQSGVQHAREAHGMQTIPAELVP